MQFRRLTAGLSLEGASRVIQWIVIGVGFIGAGSILKSGEEHLNHGLTASVGIWTTAAVGIAIGPGQVGIALITVVLIILIFVVIAALERRIGKASAAIVNGG